MIYPKDYVKEVESTPLAVTKIKRDELVAKAKELLTEPMEEGKLADLLEQFYVKDNKHYTSKQLMDIVMQVKTDLNPVSDLEIAK